MLLYFLFCSDACFSLHSHVPALIVTKSIKVNKTLIPVERLIASLTAIINYIWLKGAANEF